MDDLFEFPLETRVVNMTTQYYDIRIDRRTKWGNPFIVGTHGTREEVIEKYSEWILTQDHLIKSLPELKGKTLGCWCKPKSCHGDILVNLCRNLVCE